MQVYKSMVKFLCNGSIYPLHKMPTNSCSYEQNRIMGLTSKEQIGVPILRHTTANTNV